MEHTAVTYDTTTEALCVSVTVTETELYTVVSDCAEEDGGSSEDEEEGDEEEEGC